MIDAATRRRSGGRYGPPPLPLAEPMHQIPHLPILIFCTLVTCILLLPHAVLRSHAIIIDLPYPSSSHDLALGFPTDRIIVTPDSRILWNAEPITMAQLFNLLHERTSRDERSGLIFDPSGSADYEIALHVLAAIKASGNAEAGFCFGDLSPYRRFEKESAAPIPLAESDMRPCNPAADSRFDLVPAMPRSITTPADPPPA